MRIAVIGAGLTGVTTAHELAARGHEVTVFERRSGIAGQGSHAMPAVAAPGLWLAWAAAGTPAACAPVQGGGAWRWRVRRWRLARQAGQAARLALLDTLDHAAMACRQALQAREELDYERHEGVIALLARPMDAQRARELLDAHASALPGVRWLDEAAARAAEPGLAAQLRLEGALHWPAGQAANGRQFAQALKLRARQHGARFVLQREVAALQAEAGGGWRLHVPPPAAPARGPAAGHALPDDEPQASDGRPFHAVVMCTRDGAARLAPGAAGGPLAASAVAPAAMATVTAPLRELQHAQDMVGPRGACLDPAAGLVLQRMGDRLRAAGPWRLGQLPEGSAQAKLAAPLFRALEQHFPGAARIARAQSWAGCHGLTADGLPVLGALQPPGLWVHHSLGLQAWAWAPATARVLADLVEQRSPDVDASLLAPGRLR